MTMIYRRNLHNNRATTATDGTPHSPSAAHHHHHHHQHQHLTGLDLLDSTHCPPDPIAPNHDDDDKEEYSRTRSISRWLCCLRRRRKPPVLTTQSSSIAASGVIVGTPTTKNALSQRVCQILWLALLVYAFLGLPVLGRILNFVRYFHRFTVQGIITGLVVGLLEDVAIFVQAATVIVLIKALFQPHALHRRYASTFLSASTSSALTTAPSSSTSSMSTFGQERYPHSSFVHLPVYFPVRTNEYDMQAATTGTVSTVVVPGESSDTLEVSTVAHGSTVSGSSVPLSKHLTLLASSSSTVTSFPWSQSATASSTSASSSTYTRVKTCASSVVVLILVQVVLILATIASVADFCLQVTLHPRLNRAFVEIFVNYMAQFTASLMDEEVLTPAVVFAWSTYFVLIGALTYGFYNERLPLLPDFLHWSSSSTGTSSSSLLCCCSSLLQRTRGGYRKDSSAGLMDGGVRVDGTPATARGYMKALYQSYWKRTTTSLITTTDDASSVASTTMNPNVHHRSSRRRRNSHGHGAVGGGSGAGPSYLGGPSGSLSLVGSARSWLVSSSSSSKTWMTPKSVLGIVLHCIMVSLFVSLIALCTALIVHTSAAASRVHHGKATSSSTHGLLGLGVDMQLMANPMFSLQTEPFFTHKSRLGADQINCTQASTTLLATLGSSEVYDTEGLAKTDACALLWRRTTAYEGETFWTIDWNTTSTVQTNTTTTTNATTGTISASTTRLPPNIIVINMESWRALDVGVLGGADKKRRYGKSATPHFDRLSKQGVLYRKHYTQCVQTTRTLLTTLFGMLPSCTETTALKMYGPSGLTVRGLPHFLKSHGYFNLFWSAVDLTWEYWDDFLHQNEFDLLVDDKKVRAMLHDVRDYQDRPDDHFSWGMHDHLSFEMLLYAIEMAHNSSTSSSTTSSSSLSADAVRVATNTTIDASSPQSGETMRHKTKQTTTTSTRMRGHKTTNTTTTFATDHHQQQPTHHQHRHHTSRNTIPTVGWEGLRAPYFIDMYTITSHNPWALPLDYNVPDLSELYTRYNKRYIDSMYFSDEMLGSFIENLRAKGLMKNTIVIIEGDHGYGRLEHENNPSIADSAVYDEATHVPFLLLADDFLAEHERGLEVDQLTMQSDLMATIADLIGVSDEKPLFQHGYGHSMRRRRQRGSRTKQTTKGGEMDFDLLGEHDEPAAMAPASKAQSDPTQQSRRVVLCNPFNGVTKGIRTEDFKFVFNADGSYRVFELAVDPIEKAPVRKGYDLEQMDSETKEMFEYVSNHVDLNQFLFETNKFVATPRRTEAPVSARAHAAAAAASTNGRVRITEELTDDPQQGEDGEDATIVAVQKTMIPSATVAGPEADQPDVETTSD